MPKPTASHYANLLEIKGDNIFNTLDSRNDVPCWEWFGCILVDNYSTLTLWKCVVQGYLILKINETMLRDQFGNDHPNHVQYPQDGSYHIQTTGHHEIAETRKSKGSYLKRS